MTTPSEVSWGSRHPSNLNYLRPVGFQLSILNLPTVSFFAQKVSLPGVSLGIITQATPLYDLPWPGDKLTYERFNIEFIVQSDLGNYIELYNWFLGLGDPQNNDRRKKWVEDHRWRFPNVKNESTIGAEFSDATLTVLSASNNPIAQINFRDMFPVNMAGIPFNISGGSDTYLTVSASFAYAYHEIVPIEVQPS